MANVTLVTNNLGAGELSPKIEGRVDLAIYHQGARVMQNCIPLTTGGFRRMPGSYYVGTPVTDSAVARLVTWKAGAATYICELTNNKARFWKLDHTLYGAPLELATTYTEAQLWSIHHRNIKKTLWLAHGSHPPRYLEEIGGVPTLTAPAFTGDRTFAGAGAYPSILDFYAGRLLLGATDDEPNGIFLSRAPDAAAGTDRLTDFTLGSFPDDAIILKEGEDRFYWAVAHRAVAAGGAQGTWLSDGSVPTPLTFDLNLADEVAIAPIQAVRLGNAVLYVGAPVPSLHLIAFSGEGGHVDVDLTKYSDHILKPGVVEMTVMKRPEPILFLVRTDGVLVSCTIDLSGGQLSYGWARHLPADGGLVESATVVPTTAEDELWCVIRRGTKRYIEHFVLTEDEDFTEIHYVDSGLRKTYGVPTKTITGLDHLEGKEVDAIADGASMPRKTVSSGQVVYEKEVSKIHIGLPYASKVHPQRPEIQLNATWQAKKKRVEQSVLRLYRTLGGRVGQTEGSLQALRYLTLGTAEFGEPPTPFTGDLEVSITGVIDTDGAYWIVQDDPFPFTCLALFTRIAVMEA